SEVRPMGREAAGVRGIALGEGHEVNSLIVLREGRILTASENGYGTLTEVEEFPVHGRGGQGVIALQLSERNGRMVAALQVLPTDDFMLISQGGTLVRTAVAQVSVLGRNTQGVRLMRLEEGDRLVALARVEHINGEPGDDEEADTGTLDGVSVEGASVEAGAAEAAAASDAATAQSAGDGETGTRDPVA
ncbi:MAG: DNA gyrase C-terminal beta-propeller domain-containing protein, partial [Pseudomonadota bacterium]